MPIHQQGALSVARGGYDERQKDRSSPGSNKKVRFADDANNGSSPPRHPHGDVGKETLDRAGGGAAETEENTFSPTARIIQEELMQGSLKRRLHPSPAVRRSHSLPEGKLRPGVQKLLLAHSRRSPSANVIKKEFRYACLKKVEESSRRRSYVPLIKNKDLVLDPELYQSLLAQSRRSPSANVIKKEFRYASLRTVDHDNCRRRSEPLISTKDLLLDPDVFELLVAHSRRSPSANVIKKEFRYACLRHVRRPDEDAASLSSISTRFSSFHIDSWDEEEEENEHGHYYVYDWIMDLEPMMPLPDMFPYYEPTTFSDGGRRLSGSTLQSELVLSTSSLVSGGSERRQKAVAG